MKLSLEEIVGKIEEGEIAASVCFLCNGEKPTFTNVFVPPSPARKGAGQQEGKQRVILYGVCQPCMDEHGKTETMARMERAFRQGTVSVEASPL